MRVWCTISFMGKSAPLLAVLRGYKSSHKIQMRPVKLSLLGTQRVCGADPATEGPWSACFLFLLLQRYLLPINLVIHLSSPPARNPGVL